MWWLKTLENMVIKKSQNKRFLGLSISKFSIVQNLHWSNHWCKHQEWKIYSINLSFQSHLVIFIHDKDVDQ
jgi:hypothetical protein